MSIHRSYFNRNNTIQYNSFTNTGKSPWTELYFGSANDSISPSGFSRFIFDLDLSSLTEKFSNKTIFLKETFRQEIKWLSDKKHITIYPSKEYLQNLTPSPKETIFIMWNFEKQNFLIINPTTL